MSSSQSKNTRIPPHNNPPPTDHWSTSSDSSDSNDDDDEEGFVPDDLTLSLQPPSQSPSQPQSQSPSSETTLQTATTTRTVRKSGNGTIFGSGVDLFSGLYGSDDEEEGGVGESEKDYESVDDGDYGEDDVTLYIDDDDYDDKRTEKGNSQPLVELSLPDDSANKPLSSIIIKCNATYYHITKCKTTSLSILTTIFPEILQTNSSDDDDDDDDTNHIMLKSPSFKIHVIEIKDNNNIIPLILPLHSHSIHDIINSSLLKGQFKDFYVDVKSEWSGGVDVWFYKSIGEDGESDGEVIGRVLFIVDEEKNVESSEFSEGVVIDGLVQCMSRSCTNTSDDKSKTSLKNLGVEVDKSFDTIKIDNDNDTALRERIQTTSSLPLPLKIEMADQTDLTTTITQLSPAETIPVQPIATSNEIKPKLVPKPTPLQLPSPLRTPSSSPSRSPSPVPPTTSISTSNSNKSLVHPNLNLYPPLHPTPPPPFPSLEIKVLNPTSFDDLFLLPPNSRIPVPLDSPLFSGLGLLILRPISEGSDGFYDKLFKGRARQWEFQVQGRFKVVPEGEVFFGVQACCVNNATTGKDKDKSKNRNNTTKKNASAKGNMRGDTYESLKMGMIMRSLSRAGVGFAKRLSPGLHVSFGGYSNESNDDDDDDDAKNDKNSNNKTSKNFELPHMVFPLHTCMDEFIITPPLATPPPLGHPFPIESKEAMKKRKSSKAKYKYSTSDTYSFSFHDQYLSLSQWKISGIPMVGDIKLEGCWGDGMDLRFVFYEKVRTKEEVEFCKKMKEYEEVMRNASSEEEMGRISKPKMVEANPDNEMHVERSINYMIVINNKHIDVKQPNNVNNSKHHSHHHSGRRGSREEDIKKLPPFTDPAVRYYENYAVTNEDEIVTSLDSDDLDSVTSGSIIDFEGMSIDFDIEVDAEPVDDDDDDTNDNNDDDSDDEDVDSDLGFFDALSNIPGFNPHSDSAFSVLSRSNSLENKNNQFDLPSLQTSPSLSHQTNNRNSLSATAAAAASSDATLTIGDAINSQRSSTAMCMSWFDLVATPPTLTKSSLGVVRSSINGNRKGKSYNNDKLLTRYFAFKVRGGVLSFQTSASFSALFQRKIEDKIFLWKNNPLTARLSGPERIRRIMDEIAGSLNLNELALLEVHSLPFDSFLSSNAITVMVKQTFSPAKSRRDVYSNNAAAAALPALEGSCARSLCETHWVEERLVLTDSEILFNKKLNSKKPTTVIRLESLLAVSPIVSDEDDDLSQQAVPLPGDVFFFFKIETLGREFYVAVRTKAIRDDWVKVITERVRLFCSDATLLSSYGDGLLSPTGDGSSDSDDEEKEDKEEKTPSSASFFGGNHSFFSHSFSNRSSSRLTPPPPPMYPYSPYSSTPNSPNTPNYRTSMSMSENQPPSSTPLPFGSQSEAIGWGGPQSFSHHSSMFNSNKSTVLNCRKFVWGGCSHGKHTGNTRHVEVLRALGIVEEALKYLHLINGNSGRGTTGGNDEDVEDDELLLRFFNKTSELKSVNINLLNANNGERLTFLINLYHLMVMHSCLIVGGRSYSSSTKYQKHITRFSYQVSDDIFTLSELEHNIIKASMNLPTRTQRRSWWLGGLGLNVVQSKVKWRNHQTTKAEEKKEKYFEFGLREFCDCRLIFALNSGSVGSNLFSVPIYKVDSLERQLDDVVKEFCEELITVHTVRRKTNENVVITMPKLLVWFGKDFISSSGSGSGSGERGDKEVKVNDVEVAKRVAADYGSDALKEAMNVVTNGGKGGVINFKPHDFKYRFLTIRR